MNRRGFFGTVLGGFVAAWLPTPKPLFIWKYWDTPEMVYWLNSDDMVLRVSSSGIYHFGFSGFQAGDEDRIKGLIKWEVTPTWTKNAIVARRQDAAL